MLVEDLITSTRTASHNIWGKISVILLLYLIYVGLGSASNIPNFVLGHMLSLPRTRP